MTMLGEEVRRREKEETEDIVSFSPNLSKFSWACGVASGSYVTFLQDLSKFLGDRWRGVALGSYAMFLTNLSKLSEEGPIR